MYQTKLIAFLKCFSQIEIQKLEDFLNSPYFFRGKKIQEVQDLIHYLRRFYPNFNHPKLEKEEVYDRMFAGEKFRKRKWQHLLTKSMKAVERFIEVEYLPKFRFYPFSEFGQLLFYREKKKIDAHHKLYEKLEQSIELNELKGANYCWRQFILADEYSFVENLYKSRGSDLNLNQSLTRLDAYYLVEKLSLACGYLHQLKFHLSETVGNELDTLDALLFVLPDQLKLNNPGILLLYQTYLFLRNGLTTQDYRALKEAYILHNLEVEDEIKQITYGVLRSHCIKKMNEGRNEFYPQEIFELYKDALAKNIVGNKDGTLLSGQFLNIVMIALRLKQFYWAEQFMESYRYLVTDSVKSESVYYLCRARLCFEKGQWDLTLECLRFNFTDVYSKLVTRRIEVMVYYELDATILDAKIQAFKIFVFRLKSKVSDKHQRGNSNFIDLLKQIIHPSTLGNERRIMGLIEKVESKKLVSERKWLHQILGAQLKLKRESLRSNES